MLNGAANDSVELSPLACARKEYMVALEVRCKADAGPLHPLILRTAIDNSETLIDALIELLVNKNVLTREEVADAQITRYAALTEIIKGSVKTALEAKRRVEVARTLPPGRG